MPSRVGITEFTNGTRTRQVSPVRDDTCQSALQSRPHKRSSLSSSSFSSSAQPSMNIFPQNVIENGTVLPTTNRCA